MSGTSLTETMGIECNSKKLEVAVEKKCEQIDTSWWLTYACMMMEVNLQFDYLLPCRCC